MFIVTLFCFFIFSTLALGLIFLSQVFLKVNGWRKNSVRLDYASENGVKAGFAEIMQSIKNSASPKVISEEDYEELKSSLAETRARLLEETTGLSFPLDILETTEDMGWSSRTSYLLEKVTEAGNFLVVFYGLSIDSEGWLKSSFPRRKSHLQSRVGILAGHVPLFSFPLLINRNLRADEKASFEQSNEIQVVPWPENRLPAQAIYVAEPMIPQDADGLLEKALNIKIFRPQDLSAAKLRMALGLDESEAPVPEGVYLIQNDLGLGGIYVQGDVKEMVTAIEGNFQVISFRMEEDSWVLKFSPSRRETHFYAPSGPLFFSLTPLGIIIINGKVESLGGGMVDETGEVILVQHEEIPSLLQGVNLTLVASDEITITSHLIRQGVVWRQGIPYLKEKSGQLMIFSTGKDLWEDETREGGISIAADAPDRVEIQASLMTHGQGFRILGENKVVNLAGSLQTTDYISMGNRLEIIFQNPSEIMDAAPNAPLSRLPVLFLSSFETLEWREY